MRTADGHERALREELVALGASLFARRLTFGRTGNLSVRVGDHLLVTPTGTSLGGLDPGRLAEVGLDGSRLGARRPPRRRSCAALPRPRRPRPLTDDQAERLRAQAKEAR